MNIHVCVQYAFVCIRVCKHVTCVPLELKRQKGDHNRPTKSRKRKRNWISSCKSHIAAVARTHNTWPTIILPRKAEAFGQPGKTRSEDSGGQVKANSQSQDLVTG